MTVWKTQNYGGSKEDPWLPEAWRGEGQAGGAQRIFQGSETILYDTICKSGYMSLYTYQIPQNVQNRAGTLM